MNMHRKVCVAAAALAAWVPARAADAAEAAATTGGLTSQMTALVIQIGVILFAARLGCMLAERLKIPGVLGELAAGIVIGPYALGGVALGAFFRNGIFPPAAGGAFPVTPELYGFCTVASIVLLFLSGVETDLRLFVRYSLAGTAVGVGGVVFSYLAGSLSAVWLLPRFLGTGPIGLFSPSALFLGIMCTATSVGITARILSERKRIDSEEGVTTMAGAVIDDVLGIIVLAIGLGVIAAQRNGDGVDWGHIGRIGAKALGIWLGFTAVGIVAAHKISALLKLFRNPLPIAIMSLGLALVLAGFFEAMGLAMIIGAYVMGLAFSRTDIRYVIHENLVPLNAFMVPIFFCVMGMMVDLRLLARPPVLAFGALYTVLAILAKLVGCSIPAMLCGFNGLGALRIGAGMVPRGEVALIVAGIGLANGYLEPDVFGIGILMTLVTTVAAPPMLVALHDVERTGLRRPRAGAEGSRPFSFHLPSPDAATLMCAKLVEAFHAEGFFTHLLSYEDAIWQIRRDDIAIGMRRDGDVIEFECSPDEEGLLATAILEVVAELTNLAGELAKPVKTSRLKHLLGEPADTRRAGADPELARHLRRFVMVPRLQPGRRDAVIRELLQTLFEKGLVADVDIPCQAILEREAVMSTGLKHGIAIPHVRTDAAASLVGAVGIVRGGVSDYPTLDDAPVQIVILTLAPKRAQTPYLRLIAHIGRVLDERGRAKLLASRTEAAMLEALLG